MYMTFKMTENKRFRYLPCSHGSLPKRRRRHPLSNHIIVTVDHGDHPEYSSIVENVRRAISSFNQLTIYLSNVLLGSQYGRPRGSRTHCM